MPSTGPAEAKAVKLPCGTEHSTHGAPAANVIAATERVGSLCVSSDPPWKGCSVSNHVQIVVLYCTMYMYTADRTVHMITGVPLAASQVIN